MSTGVSSQGSTIEVNINSTFKVIPQVFGFAGPDIAKQFEDVTNLDSAGAFKEYVPTLLDTSNLTFECLAKPNDSTHKYMVQAAAALFQQDQFRINVNTVDPKSYTFMGYATKFSPKADAGKSLRYACEIRITGQVNIS